MRKDLKTNLFDAIYFLDADRIAREVTIQTIIIEEILKHRKQLVINGKDYVKNPENKFTLIVLGAVAELERAKIIERATCGKQLRLSQGQLLGCGVHTFGYDYVAPISLTERGATAKTLSSVYQRIRMPSALLREGQLNPALDPDCVKTPKRAVKFLFFSPGNRPHRQPRNSWLYFAVLFSTAVCGLCRSSYVIHCGLLEEDGTRIGPLRR